jgi:phosphoribosyl 1,2-cyclic phosphodiesterase
LKTASKAKKTASGRSHFTIRFRGVRGSHPVPGPDTVRVGGNTSCVEVQAGEHLIIFDAGTGIISLGNDLLKSHYASGHDVSTRKKITFTVLFSHTHHDHTQGFAFFKPAYIPTSTCYLFGPRLLEEELEEGLTKAMVSPYFPVQLEDLPSFRKIRSIHESEVILYEDAASQPKIYNYYRDNHSELKSQVCVRIMHSLAHPNGGVFVYRVEMGGKSVVYATDTEGYVGGDQRLVNFAKGATLLIHDSQYMHPDYVKGKITVQGYGHSTVDMAAEVAKQAGVGNLALFHYDPQYNDSVILEMEKRAKSIFKNSVAAYEGLSIEL